MSRKIFTAVCLLLVPFAACGSQQDYSGDVDLNAFTTGGGSFLLFGGLPADSAGDFNDDGHLDLVVGDQRGKMGACVIFGNGTDFADVDLFVFESGSKGFWLLESQSLISSTKGVGDVNGDGIDDIALSFPNSSPASVYIIFGQEYRTATYVDINLNSVDIATIGVRFSGALNAVYGLANVGRAGDLNNDGLDDVFLVDSGHDGVFTVVYVVFGNQSLIGDIDMGTFASGSDGFKITDSVPSLRSLRCASAAGDVNGDGIDDFVVAADSIGVTVIFGSATLTFADIDLSSLTTGPWGYQILTVGNQILTALSSADFNADGISDLLMGAAGLGSDPDTGFVMFGTSESLGTLELNGIVSGTDGFKILPSAKDDGCGALFSGAGDVNGDGIDDIVISCTSNVGNGDFAATSYVLYGSNSSTDAYDDVLLENFFSGAYTNTTGFMITGGHGIRPWTAGYVLPAGDFNEDGYGDLLTEGIGYNTYVVRGGNLPMPTTEASKDSDAAVLSTGAIIGIAVGGAAFLTIVAALCYVYLAPASAAAPVDYTSVKQAAAPSAAAGAEQAVVPVVEAEGSVELVPV